MQAVQGLRVTIARHGETSWNAIKRIQGQLSHYTELDGTTVDVTLSEKGVTQAKTLASKLSDVAFTHCFCSDLKRAVDTAKHVKEGSKFPQEFVPDARLRERSRGKWEGKFEHEFAAAPAEDKKDAETDESMCSRLFAFLDEKAQQIESGNVLIIGHERVISNIYIKIMGLSLEANKLDVSHTGTITLLYANKSWELIESQGIVAK